MTKCLLVIDPIPTHRIRLKATLRAAQYDIVSIDRIGCAASVMSTTSIDLVILNTSGTNPAQMMARFSRALGEIDVPILCRDDDAGPLRRVQALATGARDMIATRAPDPLLLARLRSLLRESEASQELERRRVAAASFGFREAAPAFGPGGNVACVNFGLEWTTPPDRFVRLPHHCSVLGVDALLRDDKAQTNLDVIVMNVPAGEDGVLNSVLPEIRSRQHLRHSSVLVLHPPEAYETAISALNLGASEIAENTSLDTELSHRIEAKIVAKRERDALRRSTEESFRLATTDALTGLFNRRYAEVYLADVLTSSQDSDQAFTVMMVDIDYFKSVNDTFGHAAGDCVLHEVAKRLRENLRAVDLVSRHGGKEFLVVLPDIHGRRAEHAADRLRASIAGSPIRLPSGAQIEVTASIGVAVAGGAIHGRRRGASSQNDEAGSTALLQEKQIEEILSRADHALYCAKDAGRNCVSVSPEVASAA